MNANAFETVRRAWVAQASVLAVVVAQPSPARSRPVPTCSRFLIGVPTSGFLIGAAVGDAERPSGQQHNLQMVGSNRLMARTERSIQVYTGLRGPKNKKNNPTNCRAGAPPAVLVRCSCAPSGSGRRPSLWSATRFTTGQAERQDEKHLECADLSALCRFRSTLSPPFPSTLYALRSTLPPPSPINQRSQLCAGLPTAHISRPKPSSPTTPSPLNQRSCCETKPICCALETQ
jgi:hypothetical protein